MAPGAGIIDAEGAVQAMLRLAVGHGARVLTDREVTEVSRTASGFRILTADGGVLEAHRLIVCAGGWLPDLLPLLPLPAAACRAMPQLTVRREQAFHFPYREHVAPPGAWATFIRMDPEIVVYGLPGGRDAGHRGQKVAEFNGGRRMPSAHAHDHRVDPGNCERVAAFARDHLPGVDPVPYAETTCLFANTPTEDFVIDACEGIVVVSPCSGRGAKFAPLIGELAADLPTGRGPVPVRFRVFPGSTVRTS